MGMYSLASTKDTRKELKENSQQKYLKDQKKHELERAGGELVADKGGWVGKPFPRPGQNTELYNCQCGDVGASCSFVTHLR